MIQPKDPKPDPKFGMAIGASRGYRGGTAGEAVNRGYREGATNKPKGTVAEGGAYKGAIAGYSEKATPVGNDRDKKKPPIKTGGDKIKPEAYKAYILARGKS